MPFILWNWLYVSIFVLLLPYIFSQNVIQNEANQNNVNIKQPNVNVQQINANVQQPDVNVQQPDVNVQQPDVNVQQTNANVQQPGVNVQQTNANVQQPDVNVQQTNANVQQPDVNVQQLNTNLQQPILNVQPLSVNSQQPKSNIWAFLAAGSKDWENYRHQSDVLHAYHVLHNHGVPADHIIVMIEDDIAYRSENPTPGVILNNPNGPNVYEGVPIDYSNKTVTPDNFLNVLQGNEEEMKSTGTGRVLKSGPEDHIFLYFSDHGALGLLAFPRDELIATDLIDAIISMHDKKKYKFMVIYIEACQSSSLFYNLLPEDINVYAVVAAKTHESSYACYFDKERNTFLGDSFSVAWMEFSDEKDISNHTLLEQYEVMKAEANGSHVLMFGDTKIGSMAISEFQGKEKCAPLRIPNSPMNSMISTDVPMVLAEQRVLSANDQLKKASLQKAYNLMKENREFLSKIIKDYVEEVKKRANILQKDVWNNETDIQNYECYKTVVKRFDVKCFKICQNPYCLRYLHVFGNLCSLVPMKELIAAMDKKCNHEPRSGIS